MMEAGALDRRIDIQVATTSRDAMGGVIPSWSNIYSNIPANIKQLSGNEKYHVECAREISYEQVMFTVRYISGLNQTYRVQFEGKIYDILAINEIPRRKGLQIVGQLAR